MIGGRFIVTINADLRILWFMPEKYCWSGAKARRDVTTGEDKDERDLQ